MFFDMIIISYPYSTGEMRNEKSFDNIFLFIPLKPLDDKNTMETSESGIMMGSKIFFWTALDETGFQVGERACIPGGGQLDKTTNTPAGF